MRERCAFADVASNPRDTPDLAEKRAELGCSDSRSAGRSDARVARNSTRSKPLSSATRTSIGCGPRDWRPPLLPLPSVSYGRSL